MEASSRGRLAVSPRAWHWRVYQHWLDNISIDPPPVVNLCHYMRVILLFTPFYYFGYALLIGGFCFGFVVFAPIWIPIYLIVKRRRGLRRAISRAWQPVERFAEWSWPWPGRIALGLFWAAVVVALLAAAIVLWVKVAWWMIPLVIAGVICFVFLVIGLIVGLHELAERRKLRPKSDKPEKEKKERGPSMTWAWLVAKKHRICPLIDVPEEEVTP